MVIMSMIISLYMYLVQTNTSWTLYMSRFKLHIYIFNLEIVILYASYFNLPLTASKLTRPLEARGLWAALLTWTIKSMPRTILLLVLQVHKLKYRLLFCVIYCFEGVSLMFRFSSLITIGNGQEQLTVSIKHVEYCTGYFEFHENKSALKYSYQFFFITYGCVQILLDEKYQRFRKKQTK